MEGPAPSCHPGTRTVRVSSFDSPALQRWQKVNTTSAIFSLPPASVFGPPHARIERYKLQQALLKQVPVGLIQLNKRLNKIEESGNGTIVHFQDETSAGPYDLVIGADGIRSVSSYL